MLGMEEGVRINTLIHSKFTLRLDRVVCMMIY